MAPHTRWHGTRSARLVVAAAVSFGLAVAVADPALAIDPAKDFKQNCSSCHTIGGGTLTGPDLKDVSKRKDRAWLVRFIVDPTGVLESGDPYALKLLREARGQRMVNIGGMSKDRAEALLDLIAAESKLEKSRFAGVQISMRPFTLEDIEAGRKLFTGEARLENGGASCIGCHTVGDLGGLGGGRLGPDLTHVFDRYEDRRKLGNWLNAPATEVMLPTFKDHPMEGGEVFSLVAFFSDATKNRREQDGPQMFVFVLLGVAGAVGVLLVFDRIWRWRFRAVRKPLIAASSVAERQRRSAGTVK